MMRTEKDKMLAGELYDASAPEIQADLAATQKWLARYNAALDMAPSERHKLLVERFAAVGDGAVIRPPFHCDYGFNIRLGAGVFLNFSCVILDIVQVTIGDRTQIGPGVQILAADIRATQRSEPRAWSLAARSASGATSGSERARSSCRAFRSVMMR
jgi:maltose O-acetyltransferase